MPLYMDIHSQLTGATYEDVRQAHLRDLEVQPNYDVRYIKYWFNEQAGKGFCLVEAPNKEAANVVHREAHGLVADALLEVNEALVDAFLGDGTQSPVGEALLASGTPDGGLRTILFTDMEGSTNQTQRLGDEGAMRFVRTHNSIVRERLTECGGREVKHTGDGIMASFVSPSRALECAIGVQRKLAEHNRERSDEGVRVRVGISAGEPVEELGDLFGAAVQLAARACAHAGPAQILVSNVVRELCIGKRFTFMDRGRARLKGFDRPVHLFEVAWQGAE